jgi:enterochelin esterase-like enzyme
MSGAATATSRQLAINRLRRQRPLDDAAVDTFLAEHTAPVVEGEMCTFLFRGHADEVGVVHRVVGLPEPIGMRRVRGTDLWYAVVELPAGSRVEYQLRVVRDGHEERGNDPLNPRLATSPMGSISVCEATGYAVPDWAQHDPDARPGALEGRAFASEALQRDVGVDLYLPARFRRTGRYPLLIVHDGGDFLHHAAAKTVLDNLIHRMDVAEVVAAFIHPADRLVEYADSAAHARFVAAELVPSLEAELPLLGEARGRCLMGSSFGAVASLSTAIRHPRTFGALLLQSGSFVFTDIGRDHGGGPVFDPVVRMVNRFRARPRRVADRVFVSCGMYEPLIDRNRAMVPVLEATGMRVRYVESRDGHSWESWRDRLRDGLSWVYPGPQKYVYE